jgi:hypothetical protein
MSEAKMCVRGRVMNVIVYVLTSTPRSHTYIYTLDHCRIAHTLYKEPISGTLNRALHGTRTLPARALPCPPQQLVTPTFVFCWDIKWLPIMLSTILVMDITTWFWRLTTISMARVW